MEDPRLHSGLPEVPSSCVEVPEGSLAEPTAGKETDEPRTCAEPQAASADLAAAPAAEQKPGLHTVVEPGDDVHDPSQDLGQSVDYCSASNHSSSELSSAPSKHHEDRSSEDDEPDDDFVFKATAQKLRNPVSASTVTQVMAAAGELAQGIGGVPFSTAMAAGFPGDLSRMVASASGLGVVTGGLATPHHVSFSAAVSGHAMPRSGGAVAVATLPVLPLFTDKNLEARCLSLASSPGVDSDEDEDDSSSGDDADNEMSEGEEMDTGPPSGLHTPNASQSEAPGSNSAAGSSGGAVSDNMSGISQLLQAAQAELTPGIEMLAAAAQNATPAGFPCPHCNKTYPMASGLRRHIKRSHSNTSTSSNGNPFASASSQYDKRPSKCTFCQADLPYPATQAVRRRHMRGECSRNPYSCASCSKVFVSPGGLQRHSLMHNGKRPFQCNICSKEFTQASHLKVHMNGHTGEKPYQCDHEDCSKTYSDPSSLRSHKLAHAGIKSKKKRNPDAPYLANPKCAYCDQRFVSRAARDQHARECSRNPYRCMICQKACLGMVKLERHIRSHSRSRVSSLKAQELAKNKKTQSPDPKCAYCIERFPTRVVRDRHSRMCTNNPYRCNLCYKAFLGSAKLLRHARSHAENGSVPSAAAAAAIEHATALAAAHPDGGVADIKFEPMDTGAAGAGATGGHVLGVEVSSGASSLVSSASPTLPALSTAVTSAGLGGMMMSPSTHPMIAVQTPLGYSFVHNPFPSLTHHLPLVTASQQQIMPQAAATQAEVPAQLPGLQCAPMQQLGQAMSTVAAGNSQSGQQQLLANAAAQPPQSATTLPTPGQSSQVGSVVPAAEAEPEQKPVVPVASPTDPACVTSQPAPTATQAGVQPNVSENAVASGSDSASAAPTVSSPSMPVSHQAASFLSSLQAPFSFAMPPSSATLHGSLGSSTGAAAMDTVPNIFHSLLAGSEALASQPQLAMQQQSAVIQHMQQLMQMQQNSQLPAQQQQQAPQQQQENFPLATVDGNKLVPLQAAGDTQQLSAAEVKMSATKVPLDETSLAGGISTITAITPSSQAQ